MASYAELCKLSSETVTKVEQRVEQVNDFSRSAKLDRMRLNFTLVDAENVSIDFEDRFRGVRTKHLTLAAKCDPNSRLLTSFSRWELEAASIQIYNLSDVGPARCRDSRVGRDLLGSLYLELPHGKVDEDADLPAALRVCI